MQCRVVTPCSAAGTMARRLPAALVFNAAVILETLASSSNGSGGSEPSIAKKRTSCGRQPGRRCETT